MTKTVKFGCDHCGAVIETAPPDKLHIGFLAESDGGLKREILCRSCGETNTRYWVP